MLDTRGLSEPSERRRAKAKAVKSVKTSGTTQRSDVEMDDVSAEPGTTKDPLNDGWEDEAESEGEEEDRMDAVNKSSAEDEGEGEEREGEDELDKLQGEALVNALRRSVSPRQCQTK